MNYQDSNPESLSETPERLSENKTRSGSPAEAGEKRAAEMRTSCTKLEQGRQRQTKDCMTWWCTVQFARAFPGSDVIPRGDDRFTHYRDVHYQNFVLVKGL